MNLYIYTLAYIYIYISIYIYIYYLPKCSMHGLLDYLHVDHVVEELDIYIYIYTYIHIFSNPVVDRIWKCRTITSKMGKIWNLS